MGIRQCISEFYILHLCFPLSFHAHQPLNLGLIRSKNPHPGYEIPDSNAEKCVAHSRVRVVAAENGNKQYSLV